MKGGRLRDWSAIMVGLSMLFLYLLFLYGYYFIADWSNLTWIESAIFTSQLLRAAILFFAKLKWQIPPLFTVITFSFEAMLIAPLLVLYFYTRDLYFANMMGLILTSWMGVSAIVVSPYAIFGFTKNLFTNSSLKSKLLGATFELIGMLFIATIVNDTTQPISGFSNLGKLLIFGVRNQTGVTGMFSSYGDLAVAGCSLIFFVSMLIYLTLSDTERTLPVAPYFALILTLVATLLLMMWIYIALFFVSDILVILTAPTIILGAVMWGATRGKN